MPSNSDAASSLPMVCPTISVVIPCHNDGAFLDEAVASVLAQTRQDFEVIVVDDGSTDPATIALLSNYKRPKTRVVRTGNQGLPAARNTGIALARGTYILPLDADDKIGSTYLEKATRLLEEGDNIGIVYCEAEFFGANTGAWELPPYRFPEILLDNVIFCSGMFRRTDWEKVGGYNRNMVYGWEDYDFWLSLIEAGRQVRRIPEVLFYYRKRSRSLTAGLSQTQFVQCYVQLYKNHPKLYSDNIETLFGEILELRAQLQRTNRLLRLVERLGYSNLKWLRDLIAAGAREFTGLFTGILGAGAGSGIKIER